MTCKSATIAAVLLLATAATNTQAQTASTATKSGDDAVRTFYLTNISQPSDATEITTAVRNLPRSQGLLRA